MKSMGKELPNVGQMERSVDRSRGSKLMGPDDNKHKPFSYRSNHHSPLRAEYKTAQSRDGHLL